MQELVSPDQAWTEERQAFDEMLSWEIFQHEKVGEAHQDKRVRVEMS